MGDNLIDGHVLEHLREIEEAAEEVLSEKQEIVDLDRKRNQNRQGYYNTGWFNPEMRSCAVF